MMQNLDRENLTNCPWCGSSEYENWGNPVRNFISVKCTSCGLVYVKNRFNSEALEQYYKNYLSGIHQADHEKNLQRTQMYQLEFDALNQFSRPSYVLDIGCSGGYFLDLFKENGYNCFGIEIGKEAAEIAAQRHTVWHGDFEKLSIEQTFDVIVFRAVLQHVPYPKIYLEKACSLLNQNGIIFITSTPNSSSICCDLFKENWNLHAPEAHLMHFSTKHFDDYFKGKYFVKLFETSFYTETPYAKPESDILMVADAIKLNKAHREITFRSPSFWGNMMTLIFRKADNWENTSDTEFKT